VKLPYIGLNLGDLSWNGPTYHGKGLTSQHPEKNEKWWSIWMWMNIRKHYISGKFSETRINQYLLKTKRILKLNLSWEGAQFLHLACQGGGRGDLLLWLTVSFASAEIYKIQEDKPPLSSLPTLMIHLINFFKACTVF